MAEPQQATAAVANRDQDKPKDKSDLTEKVVFINRCAKVVKGGRRFSFSALIVTGDKKGKVGCGFGKANEVSEAIRKASESAKKSLVKIAVQRKHHPARSHRRARRRPRLAATGIARNRHHRRRRRPCRGRSSGHRDVLAKSLGSSNHANVVKATIEALLQLRQRERNFQDSRQSRLVRLGQSASLEV